MLDNPTPSIQAHKVLDYDLLDYWVKLYIAKYLSIPINYPLKPVRLWNVSLSDVGLWDFTVFVDIKKVSMALEKS